MDNYIIKTLAYDKQVRILFVENTDLIGALCNQPNLNKLLRTVLGNTICVASLVSGLLKDNQRVSLKVKASNRNYCIFADVDSTGNVRGYMSEELLNAPSEYMDEVSMEQLIGKRGCIQVMKDIGMNHIFTGITDMPYGNIVDDFSHYFKQSEQTPSFFSTTLVFNERDEVVISRGVVAQLLPGAPARLLNRIRKLILDHQLQFAAIENSKALKDIIHILFENIDILSIDPIQLSCECSKQLFLPMLYALGREELKHAYENNDSIQFVCHSCGEKYSFHPFEIVNLL